MPPRSKKGGGERDEGRTPLTSAHSIMLDIARPLSMPRRDRIDALGAFRHIIGCGIERRKIFNDDKDRYDLFSRPGDILEQTHSPC